MNISTTIICAACKENGEIHRLMYTAESFPKIFCQSGHEFDSAEEAVAYEAMARAAQPAQDTAPSPAPARPLIEAVVFEPPPERVPDRILASIPHETRPPEPEPNERLVPRKVETIESQQDKLKTIAATIQAQEAEYIEVAESPKTPPKKNGKFVPPPARSAPGGILIMTVRIPDGHTTGLLAEAEVQKESIQDYFQRMIEYALDCRWLY